MPFEMPQMPESQRPTRRLSEEGAEDINIDAGIPAASVPEESGVHEKKLSAKEQLGLADPVPSAAQAEPSEIVARGTMPVEGYAEVAWNKDRDTVSALGTVPVEGDLDKPPFAASRIEPKPKEEPPRKAA